MNINKKNRRPVAKRDLAQPKCFFTSQKTCLGNKHPPERNEVAGYKTNILG